MPQVSIVVPCYNHEAYLRARLDSIYQQTFRDYEVILLDDCSPDGSPAILQEYAERHKTSTRFIPNETNSGHSYSQWIKGIQLAQGSLIWIAESDDRCRPEMLGRLVNEFRNHPNLAIAYAQSTIINQHDEETHLLSRYVCRHHPERWNQSFRNKGTDEIRDHLIYQNTIPNGSAVLFRKAFFQGIEEEMRRYRMLADWVMYSHLLSQGDISFVAEPLNYYRIHPTGQTSKKGKTRMIYDEQIRGTRTLFSKAPFRVNERARACVELLPLWYYMDWIETTTTPFGQRWADLSRVWSDAGVPMHLVLGALGATTAKRAIRKLMGQPPSVGLPDPTLPLSPFK